MFTVIKRKILDFIAAQKLKQNYHRNKNGTSKEGMSKRVVFTIFLILFLVQSFICIFPLLWCISNALRPNQEYLGNPNSLFTSWHFEYIVPAIKAVHYATNQRATFIGAIFNSFWFAFGTQFLNILASLFVAYPLARYNFPGRGFFYGIIIFRITVPIVGTSAVGYKLELALNMINNPPIYMIGAFNGFDMNALIMYGYIKAVSKEYSEAAFLDGASALQVLFKVVVPQAFPCALALYVNSVMGQWNNYNAFLVSLTEFPNLAVATYNMQNGLTFADTGGYGSINNALFYWVVLLSGIVPLVLFAASQKLMIKNMAVGGLKG